MINSKGYSDKKENNTEKLSEKELEIITLVSEGMSNKEDVYKRQDYKG